MVEEAEATWVHTAAIEAVHPKDVSRAHLGRSADSYIVVGDRNDGWLPVPREGKPDMQIHIIDERFELYTVHMYSSKYSARTTSVILIFTLPLALLL